MKWEKGRRSDNVQDVRGKRGKAGAKLGLGGLVLVLVASAIFGVDPSTLLQQMPANSSSSAPAAPRTAEENRQADFISVVLADTEDTWNPLFAQMGKRYVEPKLVLFTGSVQSACGFQSAAVGPFYCPGDQKAYIDLSFFDDLHKRFGAPGDFAQAYVLAHEVGHHVQNLLGDSQRAHSMKRGKSEAAKNEVSVRQELQADCYAGIWAHYAQKARDVVEAGDIEEALNAANQIGDDRIQMRSRGYVAPESFTHGTAEQRARWFRRGFESGRVDSCNTYDARQL